MGKRMKPKRKKQIGGKNVLIPQPEPGSTDGDSPVFSFKDCDERRFCLEDLEKRELRALMKFFKKIEGLTWGEIPRVKGLRYEIRPANKLKYDLPSHLSEDLTLIHLAIDGQARIWGHRQGRVFYIIWFDKDHKVDNMS